MDYQKVYMKPNMTNNWYKSTYIASFLASNPGVIKLRDQKIDERLEIELSKLKTNQTRMNIMLVGVKGTGKTSFLKLFTAKFEDFAEQANLHAEKGGTVTDFDLNKLKSDNEYLIGKFK